jgi:hypothetical protein
MPSGVIIVDSSSAGSGVTPAAGDTTFGQMKSDVAAFYGMDQDSAKVALAGRVIFDIIDELNMKQVWIFNMVTSAPIVTVSATSTYSLPTDFWKAYNARKTSDIDYQLDIIRQKQFDTMFVSQLNINGYPYVLVIKNTFRNGTVQLFPVPDAGYTFTINYFKFITKPASDTSYLDLPTPYQVVLKYGALSRFGALNHQPDLMQFWQKLYDQAYADMKASDEDLGDEVDLRFMNVEEIAGRSSYINPSVRPRAYDMF